MNRRDFSLFSASFLGTGLSAAALLASPAGPRPGRRAGRGPRVHQAAVAAAADPPGKIEVLEFFSYACPHCNAFEPTIEAWAKTLPADVVLRRVPVPFLMNYDNFQHTYYALETIGAVDAMQMKIFQRHPRRPPAPRQARGHRRLRRQERRRREQVPRRVQVVLGRDVGVARQEDGRRLQGRERAAAGRRRPLRHLAGARQRRAAVARRRRRARAAHAQGLIGLSSRLGARRGPLAPPSSSFSHRPPRGRLDGARGRRRCRRRSSTPRARPAPRAGRRTSALGFERAKFPGNEHVGLVGTTYLVDVGSRHRPVARPGRLRRDHRPARRLLHLRRRGRVAHEARRPARDRARLLCRRRRRQRRLRRAAA